MTISVGTPVRYHALMDEAGNGDIIHAALVVRVISDTVVDLDIFPADRPSYYRPDVEKLGIEEPDETPYRWSEIN